MSDNVNKTEPIDGYLDSEGNYYSPKDIDGNGCVIKYAPYNKAKSRAWGNGYGAKELPKLLQLEKDFSLDFAHDRQMLFWTGVYLVETERFEEGMEYFQRLLDLVETDKRIDGVLPCKKDLVSEICCLASLAEEYHKLRLNEDQITRLHNLCIDHTQISPELDKSEPEDKKVVRSVVRTNEAFAAWELGEIFIKVGKYKEANDAFFRAYDGYKSHPCGANYLRDRKSVV